MNNKKVEYKELFRNGDLILDDDQQTAVITDNKYNLIVAGAGSGKTEVLITRIAYLIKRKSQSIKPERILALAFQNKAAIEIKERLKKRYNINVEIRTFHSLGKKIIEDASKLNGCAAPAIKPECSEDYKYLNFIRMLFEKEASSNSKLQNDIVSFMKRYADNEVIKVKSDFEKKEDFYRYQRSLMYSALDGTKVKSEAEREILNYFLTHKLNDQKIKIIYEHPAYWMKYRNENGEEIIPKPDFYFPDYDIYLEHWAIGSNGRVPEWFSGENPTKEYTDSMNLKKEKYKVNRKILIETYHADYEKGSFTSVLQKRFLEALKVRQLNVIHEIKGLSYIELIESVWDCAQFVKQLPFNISQFIVIAKTNRLYPADIAKRIKNERWTPKQIAFTKIANLIYEMYQNELLKNNHIDFADMINVAVDHLKNDESLYNNTYDSILIDEYQDISTQRYDMIRELINKNAQCKLFCVGDDWQSIMGFAGSNLDFFVHFDKYFTNPSRTDLTINYRSIKSIVDTGAGIIRNNRGGQIQKVTKSVRDEIKPIHVFSSMHSRGNFNKYYEQIAKHCLDTIKEYCISQNYSYGDFMILMRIAKNPKLRNFISDYAGLLKIPITENADRPNCVRIMSVHKSKGLQSKVVMILKVDEGLYGFPCELENPDVLLPAILNDDGLRMKEERRLFYVAVTRAKEEVFIYS
ncbi:MAG: UvrD-helicase domain-containing protein, partial [Chitinispirillaceae bacterium]|nr:UvrD-helicase domain-containing protein [Chitinispirillaceae bacterium]